jgi:hypothetical protein
MYNAMQASWLTHVKALSTTPSASLQRMLELCSNGSETVRSETAATAVAAADVAGSAAALWSSVDEGLNMLMCAAAGLQDGVVRL